MRQIYRVKVGRPRSRRRAYALLVVGALCLYLASFAGRSPATTQEVLVTQEITLPQTMFYFLSFGSADSSACALAISARYASRGAAGVLWQAGDAQHAAAAAFFDRESAAACAKTLASVENIPVQMLEQALPVRTLRLTASQAQVKAIVGADSAMFRAAKQLGELAQQVDSGKVDLAGAQSAIEEMQVLLSDCAQQLADCESGAAAALTALLNAQNEGLDDVLNMSFASRMQYSSVLRARQIGLLRSLLSWRLGEQHA